MLRHSTEHVGAIYRKPHFYVGPQQSPRTFLLLPTVGEQMCRDTTQTVPGVVFLVVENKRCLSLCAFDDLESPSAGSSASCRGQKTPFSSSCCRLHCCRPPLRHTCKVRSQRQSSASNKSITDSVTEKSSCLSKP